MKKQKPKVIVGVISTKAKTTTLVIAPKTITSHIPKTTAALTTAVKEQDLYLLCQLQLQMYMPNLVLEPGT